MFISIAVVASCALYHCGTQCKYLSGGRCFRYLYTDNYNIWMTNTPSEEFGLTRCAIHEKLSKHISALNSNF